MEQTKYTNHSDRYIRARELKKLLGVSSDATIWRWIQSGKLPQPQYINSCRVWRESELKVALSELIIDQPPSTPMAR